MFRKSYLILFVITIFNITSCKHIVYSNNKEKLIALCVNSVKSFTKHSKQLDSLVESINNKNKNISILKNDTLNAYHKSFLKKYSQAYNTAQEDGKNIKIKSKVLGTYSPIEDTSGFYGKTYSILIDVYVQDNCFRFLFKEYMGELYTVSCDFCSELKLYNISINDLEEAD